MLNSISHVLEWYSSIETITTLIDDLFHLIQNIQLLRFGFSRIVFKVLVRFKTIESIVFVRFIVFKLVVFVRLIIILCPSELRPRRPVCLISSADSLICLISPSLSCATDQMSKLTITVISPHHIPLNIA